MYHINEDWGGVEINFSDRQKRIIEIVKNNEPIPSKKIASKLDVTRSALRSDLSVLTMANILEAKPRVGYFYLQDSSYLTEINKLYTTKVNEIKSVPVVVTEKTSVYDAITTLFLEDVGSLFVVDEEDKKLIGVLSRKDLLKITLGDTDVSQIPVSVTMTRMPNIVTIRADDNVIQAAKRLINHEIDALPVVENFIDESGNPIKDNLKIIGRVSKTNITRVLADLGLEM
ncbi:CBS domain-containing protein [Sporohalobacter salinus]|uniref:CBS domain-containing protein n=1 Tax=Sporohalobacter salinus TaxID=1494606 RepID=UPI001960DFDA|nr:CBS domain-containing protein [Sporohalobacter salinus]MBM7623189.1 CBS domain-containing protein [Sporohalobacter salinus]